MTNEKIIFDIAATLWGIDVVQDMIIKGKDIPLHTLQNWSDRGYRVKKGEHGIETRLWKKRKSKDVLEEDADQISNNNNFYLTKAFLFRGDQVIKIDESEDK